MMFWFQSIASMSCGCICLLVFSAYLNEACSCLTSITSRFKQCNWHHLDAAADPTGQCHRQGPLVRGLGGREEWICC